MAKKWKNVIIGLLINTRSNFHDIENIKKIKFILGP